VIEEQAESHEAKPAIPGARLPMNLDQTAAHSGPHYLRERLVRREM
jgi:hypothetical protein